MSIDLSQFHGVFFEESFEGLEIMETELLELDFQDPGEEEINKIFRAAHWFLIVNTVWILLLRWMIYLWKWNQYLNF